MIIGVCGTAGRLGAKLTKDDFQWMVNSLKDEISSLDDEVIVIKTGGAAWADHVGVKLFLEKSQFSEKDIRLHLCLPAPFLTKGYFSIRSEAGRTSNRLHRNFSDQIKTDSLRELHKALTEGAFLEVKNGFKERNTRIADCDILLAYGTAPGDVPQTAGTLDTWTKCSAPKKYIQIRGHK